MLSATPLHAIRQTSARPALAQPRPDPQNNAVAPVSLIEIN